MSTPKFTREMLEELEVAYNEEDVSVFEAKWDEAFPSIRDELNRLWEHEDHYKRMIKHEKDGYDYVEVMSSMHVDLARLLDVIEEQREEIKDLKSKLNALK